MPSKNDPSPPSGLEALQGWFARALSRPLLPGNLTRPEGVAGPSLREEAEARIRAHNGVDGWDRLALYNRQYWFRLIDCMQSEYPCAVHRIGLDDFNSWVVRYLNAHPSGSPYLAELDTGFLPYLEEHYRGENRASALEALAYDQAFSLAFDAPEGKPLRPEGIETAALKLAPHAVPLWLHWDFGGYRLQCRDDEALTGAFPLAPKEYGAVIYRHENTLYEKEITRPAFHILTALKRPYALPDLFAALEPEIPSLEMTGWEENLAHWFQEWVELGWLADAGP